MYVQQILYIYSSDCTIHPAVRDLPTSQKPEAAPKKLIAHFSIYRLAACPRQMKVYDLPFNATLTQHLRKLSKLIEEQVCGAASGSFLQRGTTDGTLERLMAGKGPGGTSSLSQLMTRACESYPWSYWGQF